MKTPQSFLSEKEPTEAEVQHAAYLLWIEEGQPEGRDLEHWLAAKELLRHHHARTGGDLRRRAPRRERKSLASAQR